jgi:glycogen synthase
MSKRILILSWEIYPIYCGGLGILVNHLVKELIRQGNIVDVVVPNDPQGLNQDNIINLNKQIQYYTKNQKRIPKLEFNIKLFNTSNTTVKDNKVNTIYPNDTPQITVAYAHALKDYLVGKEYDMILGMDWLTIPSFCLLQQSGLQTPFYFYINGTEVDRNYGTIMSRTSKTIHNLEKRFYKKAKKIFTVSSVSKNVLVNYLDCSNKQITIIHNDSEIKELVIDESLRIDKRILFLGRLAYQKGLRYLMTSFNKLVKLDPEAKLVIVGDGEEKVYIEKYIKNKQLESKVTLLKWVDGIAKQEIYQSAKLFIMPSVSEPFGLTALESIRHGVPILASSRCGFCDIVPSTPTFDYQDTSLQAKEMYNHLNDEQLWQKLLNQQRKEVLQHDWSKQVSKILVDNI